jgi:predicted acetylornithine/succinylornithine family transaminase
MARIDKVVMQTYGRNPIMLVRGEGCKVYDEDGREYLDFVAGIAVCALGHAHPRLVEAVCDQMGRLTHVSNLYYTEPQVRVAEKLVNNSFGDRVFFCNSGAEANEGAIKLARAFAKQAGRPEAYHVICAEKSFHGRTLATLTATGQDKVKKGFEPVVDGFRHVPFGDLAAVEREMDEAVAAVLVEPILGEGGVVVPPDDYLPGLRRLCDQRGALLMFDEIQTGLGRTGKLWGHRHWPVTPDVMTLAKGLAGGLPMGAVVATEEAASALTPGMHATTFGAGPVICAAAEVVLEELIDHGLIAHVENMGDRLRQGLEALQKNHPDRINQVRSRGLMAAMELSGPGADLVQALMKRGFLVNCVQDNVLRFLPPLVVEPDQIEALLAALEEEL